ncbi:MAG TPA: alpha-L-fucosidase [Chloroflexota bacterium]|nr:alpha-L-fucosidase [Chloroflexota bacterium]
MDELAFRQVHLDFHTSGDIPDVGADFDAQEFVATLQRARVNSVTCFAKCHHGYSYYPTAVGVPHPHLSRDLLGEQVEACKRAGIRVPAYVSVVWDEQAAATHQEWLQIDRQGREVGRGPLDVSGWRWLCLNTPYVDYVAAQTEEVLRRYDVDGIFFDIIMQTAPGCVCDACRMRLAEQGADPADDGALAGQSLALARDFMHRMTGLVHHIRPEASVFYNSRLRLDYDSQRGSRHELLYYTHVEIESLPSGAWGYNHYPLFSRYFQPLGKDLLGMTARFHKSWADFGGLKNEAALQYECFAMLASGAKCSVGDQLHPRGRLEDPAYRRIGGVFEAVEAKEPWCRGAQSVAEIGVLLASGQPAGGWPGAGSQASALGGGRGDEPAGRAGQESDEGALRILLESGRTFHFLDAESELSDYALLLLPDGVRVGPSLAQKLRDFLAQGGALVLSGESGLDPAGSGFPLREIPLRSLGPSPWATPYLRVDPEGPLARDVEPMEHAVYERGWAVELAPGPAPGASGGASGVAGPGAGWPGGVEVLAHVVPPYFNRDHLHFSSHAQTPPAVSPGAPLPVGASPAAVRAGRVVYLSFPLCRAYRRHGSRVYRTLVRNAIDLLLPQRLVTAGLPSYGQVTVLRQPETRDRLVVHLLAYPVERRTAQLDVIEDVVPLRDVPLSLRPGFRPSRVYEAPSETPLPFSWEGGQARLTVPLVAGHAMVAFEP